MTNFEMLQGLVEHVMQDPFLASTVNAFIVKNRDTVKFSYQCDEEYDWNGLLYDNHIMYVYISEDQQTVSVHVWYVNPDGIRFLIYDIGLMIGDDQSRGVINFNERQASYPRRFGCDVDRRLLDAGIYSYFKIDFHKVEDKPYTLKDTMEDAKRYQKHLKNPQPTFEEFIHNILKETIEAETDWDVESDMPKTYGYFEE